MTDRNFVPLPGRIFGTIPGLVFVGMAIAIVGLVWTDELPFFFQMFATLIAVLIGSVGATVVFMSIRGVSLPKLPGGLGRMRRRARGEPGDGYECPGCGARLDGKVDVSPSGDVKCGYCKSWFNVH